MYDTDDGHFVHIVQADAPYNIGVVVTDKEGGGSRATDGKVEGFRLWIRKLGVFAPSPVRANTKEVMENMADFFLERVIDPHWGIYLKYAEDKARATADHKARKAMRNAELMDDEGEDMNVFTI